MLGDFFANLFSYLNGAVQWIVDGFEVVIKSSLYFIFDGLLTCIELLLSLISIPNSILTLGAEWGLLNPQMVYVVNACKIPQGVMIILSAIAIRIALNLIPGAFTRI